MAVTRQQLEQQLVAAHRTKNVQAAQQAAYAIRAYDQNSLSAQVPSINAPPPIERVPKPTFGSWLENVGIGIGEGLGEQVQGIGELAQRGVSALGAYAQDPLKASAAAFMGALAPAMRGFTQPAQVAKDVGTGVVETGKQMYQQATSGPVGLGTVIGQNLDLPGPGGQRRPTMAELDVYHGTPHTFDPETGAPLGRFRSSKIGTGEGAQTYGYGLYFAESRDTGATYRNPGGPRGGTIPIDIDGVAAGRWSQKPGLSPVEARAADAIARTRNPDFAIEYLKQDAGYSKTAAEAIDWIKQNRQRFSDPGNLYKVDLPDAKIEQMLDWDDAVDDATANRIMKAIRKHKGAQSSEIDRVKNVANYEDALGMSPAYRGQPDSGSSIYRLLSSDLGGDAQASQFLKDIGIPGIKYLDAGSRDGGKGTRNFVVFPGEEQNLTILERDGVKAEVPKPKTPSFTDALNNLVRPDLEDDQVFSKPLPPADADNLDYVGKFGASSTGTGGMHVSVRDEVKDAGPHEFFFYDNNDEPLGFARLTKNKKQASINMIAFNEEGRGRGLGKSFYKYLLDDLDVEVKSDKEITQGTARIYESLAKEYPTRVDYDGRVVISPKYK